MNPDKKVSPDKQTGRKKKSPARKKKSTAQPARSNAPLILVPRPGEPGEALAAELSKQDLDARWLPLLRIEALDPGELGIGQAAMLDAEVLIFVSANAARIALSGLDKIQVTLLSEKIIVAVGDATRQALLDLGCHHVLVPDTPDSEGILALNALQDIADKKVTLCRGRGGRELIRDTLTEKGAEVSVFESYRRLGPDAKTAKAWQQLLGKPEIISRTRVTIITSGEMLEQLAIQLDKAEFPRKQMPILAVGKRLQTLATDAGFDPVITAGEAANATLVRHCLDYIAQSQQPREESMTDPESGAKNPQSAKSSPDNKTTKSDAAKTAKSAPATSQPAAGPARDSDAATATGTGQPTSSTQKDKPDTDPDKPDAPISDADLRKSGQDSMTAARLQPREPARKKRGTGRSWPAWLALLLFLVLGAGLTYLWQEQQKLQQNWQSLRDDTRTQNQQLSNRIDSELRQTQSTLEQELSAVRDRLPALERSVEQLREQMIETRKITRITSEGQQDAWLLAEAEFLLRQASQQLALGHDVDTALALLGSADERLRAVDDDSLLKVRQAIANDEAQLRALARPDVEGIVLKLQALIGQIPDLPLAALTLPETIAGDTDPDTAAGEDWQANLRAAWAEIRDKVVVVRHHDEPLQPLMSPDERRYLNQNLSLALQSAELAVLRRQQAIYESELEQARAWTRNFFQQENPATRGFIESLNQLHSKKIAPEFPDRLASLPLLKAINEVQLKDWLRQRAQDAESRQDANQEPDQ